MKKKLTKELMEEYLKDVFLKEDNNTDRTVKLWVQAWYDEDGVFHCPFMEEVDKEMKKYVEMQSPYNINLTHNRGNDRLSKEMS